MGIVLTKAWDQVYAWYTGSSAQNNVFYGIAGLTTIIIFIVIGFLLALYYLRKLNIKYKETSINIYNRKSGIKLDEFLNKANREIHIFGITLEETTGSFINVIETKLGSENIHTVHILMYDPNTQLREQINALVNSDIGTAHSSLNRLRISKTDLGKDGDKLEIRVFDGIPIQSMFILDPEDESRGVMRVEPYVYSIRKEDRRIHELTMKSQKKLFKTYWQSYNKMWNSSRRVDLVSTS